MNFFNGFGGLFGGKRHCGNDCGEGENNCLCTIIFIIFLLQICGCGNMEDMGIDCCDLILLLLLLSCLCGGDNNNRHCC